MLQMRVSVRIGHAAPRLLGAVVIFRVRVCECAAQSRLHCDHAPHWDTLQFIGAAHSCFTQRSHLSVELDRKSLQHVSHVLQPEPRWHAHGKLLHVRFSKSSGQTEPPCSGLCVITRVRFCVPPPHMIVHGLHIVQLLTEQFTTQGGMPVQFVETSVKFAVHGFPSPLGYCFTTRVRVRVPAPQVTEQADQLAQSPRSQSAEHCFTLVHAADSVKLPQNLCTSAANAWADAEFPVALAAFAAQNGSVTWRVRLCVKVVAHVELHWLQLPHAAPLHLSSGGHELQLPQAPTSQQGEPAQERCSMLVSHPRMLAEPFVADFGTGTFCPVSMYFATSTGLQRRETPLPHVALHGPHGRHSPNVHCKGHGCVLHARVSVCSEHVLPSISSASA